MSESKEPYNQALLDVIDCCLQNGSSIQIDGVGSFSRDRRDRLVFIPTGRPLVFLAYAHEDAQKVKRLFKYLCRAGMEPWMDSQKLLPGQNWPRAIERAIEAAQFFVACFSSNSVRKRGQFQSELAFALDIAKRIPKDELFFLPVRLDDCEVPDHIARSTHYVDLFPEWDPGVRRLIAAIRRPLEGGGHAHQCRQKIRPREQ